MVAPTGWLMQMLTPTRAGNDIRIMDRGTHRVARFRTLGKRSHECERGTTSACATSGYSMYQGTFTTAIFWLPRT